MKPMKPILYSSIRCPHSLKTAIFLSEKQVDFVRVEVDLKAKQQHTAPYLAKNPEGTVPAFEDGSVLLGDSLDIMRYVDTLGAAPRLFPEHPEGLSAVLRWIERADTDFWDVSHHLFWQLVEPPVTGTDSAEVRRLKEKGQRLLEELDAILEHQAFVCGEYTAADTALLPWVYAFRRYDLPVAGSCPHVIAWRDRLVARPSFAANYKQAGEPLLEFLERQSSPRFAAAGSE